MRATVRRDGDHLTIATKRSYYLPDNQTVALTPLSSNEFRISSARNDRLRFDANGLVINPVHWPIAAVRVNPTR